MKQFIVDAFTDHVFGGNQAAVCVMDRWPDDALMQKITIENKFSETAFAVKEGEAYHLRWFTPGGEIDFCGHATLGTSYVLFRFYEPDAQVIRFITQVGELTVERDGSRIIMDFPAYSCKSAEVTEQMADAIGAEPLEAYMDRDLLLVLKDAETVRKMQPDMEKLMQLDGLLTVVTAPSDDPAYDSVSRVFGPKLEIDEDPVTGSSHCMITPYWCDRLGKDSLTCFQASERSGILYTQRVDDRIKVAGEAVLYSEGEILRDDETAEQRVDR